MTFVFGPFRLDDRSLELWRGGRRIPIRPQPCRLLAILASRPNELITREELIAALWEDGTHVNFDLGLSSCLKQARAALGDKAEHPAWIATLPRRGYKFLRPVKQEEQSDRNYAKRLLVLPVRALPAGDSTSSLAAGLSEEVEIRLARVGDADLAVLAAAVVPDALSGGLSPRALRDAGVDLVLDCRMHCGPSTLRVTSQLIDAADQVVLWADIFDGTHTTIENQFETQRSIARRIAEGVLNEVRGVRNQRRLAG